MTRSFRRGLMLSVGLMLALGAWASPARAAAPEPFTIVAIPDTQNYVRKGYGDLYETKVRWIVDNADALNIVFVTHEGDIVQNGRGNMRSPQWVRAHEIMSLLDGVVPYSVSIGDHDYNYKELYFTGTSHFVHYFGEQRYEGEPWYGGAHPSQTSHYQFIKAGGRTYLHLNLECDVPGKGQKWDHAAWAQAVIDQYPGMPTIVTTHDYATDGKKLFSSKYVGRTNSPELWGKVRRSGEDIWNDLIRKNPQIFLVLCGNHHVGPPFRNGNYHQVSYNDAGMPVIEMLANYQGYRRGGDGFLRLVTFDETAGEIRFRTYSPTRGEFRRDYPGTPRSSDFAVAMNFNERLGPRRLTHIAGVRTEPTED